MSKYILGIILALLVTVTPVFLFFGIEWGTIMSLFVGMGALIFIPIFLIVIIAYKKMMNNGNIDNHSSNNKKSPLEKIAIAFIIIFFLPLLLIPKILIPFLIFIIGLVIFIKIRKKLNIENNSAVGELSLFTTCTIATVITIVGPLIERFDCLFSDKCKFLSLNYFYAMPFWIVLTNIFAITFWLVINSDRNKK